MVKSYVPVLKTKSGELKALAKLDPEIKELITPFLDIHKYVYVEVKTKKPGKKAPKRKTTDEHLQGIVDNILKYWGQGQRFFIDAHDINLTERLTNGLHPVSFVLNSLITNKLNPIVCIGLDRDDAYYEAVKKLGESIDVCLRIHKDDLNDLDSLKESISNVMKKVNRQNEQLVLLLDFRHIGNEDLKQLHNIVLDFSQSMDLRKWKEFIVCAGSFPEDMTDVKKDSIATIERKEIEFWKMLSIGEESLYRKPIFSDYTIVHPDKQELTTVVTNAAAKIRYTQEDHWRVFRGSSIKLGKKFAQFHDLAKLVATSNEYMGEEYCSGNAYISKCAAKKVGTGNLTTWIEVDVNNHITLTAEQFAILHDS